MKVNHPALLTAIIWVTGLNLSVTQAQSFPVLLTSVFNNLVVQISPLSANRKLDLASSEPPVDGRPDDRTPAGTRATKVN